MNEEDIKQEIQKHVLERVRGGTARMHSRAYFAARIIFTGTIALISLLLSALVLSFIVFSIHESGEQFLLGFGSRGFLTFLTLFPWFLFAFDVAILILLEWLLQGFKFGYRISLLSVFAGVICISAFLALALNLTPIHRALLDRADKGDLPIVGEMYEGIHDSHQDQGVFRGTVISLHDSQVVIAHDDGDRDADDGMHTVTILSGAAPVPPLHVGDKVYILGNSVNGVIEARGVQVFSDDE